MEEKFEVKQKGFELVWKEEEEAKETLSFYVENMSNGYL